MNPNTYRVLHLGLSLVLGVSGIFSWRIYYRYARVHLPETSAWAMMKRLRREGNPDGARMLISSMVSIVAGIGLLLLLNLR